MLLFDLLLLYNESSGFILNLFKSIFNAGVLRNSEISKFEFNLGLLD